MANYASPILWQSWRQIFNPTFVINITSYLPVMWAIWGLRNYDLHQVSQFPSLYLPRALPVSAPSHDEGRLTSHTQPATAHRPSLPGNLFWSNLEVTLIFLKLTPIYSISIALIICVHVIYCCIISYFRPEVIISYSFFISFTISITGAQYLLNEWRHCWAKFLNRFWLKILNMC